MGGPIPPPPLSGKRPKKFDTHTSFSLNLYVLIQFICTLAALVIFMFYFRDISWFYRICFFLMLILSTMITGAVMENKRWVYFAEYCRLALTVICVDSYCYYWNIFWFDQVLKSSIGLFILFSCWFTFSWMASGRKEKTLHY
jgi:hypothetical protein